jgi:type IV secretory pathway VirD2 relaxase
VKQAERDLGTPLEWVAVTHFNTEHPHVHLVVRGRRTTVRPHTAARVRSARPSAGCRQGVYSPTGPRTELDAIAAEEREVSERRYTSLDRTIERLAPTAAIRGSYTSDSTCAADVRQQHVSSRLAALQTMGLAEPVAQTIGAFDGISRPCYERCKGL